MIDVHSHLCLEDFDLDRAQVIEEAKQAGVTAILDSGETFSENEKVLQLSELHPILKPSLGFSPCNLKKADAKLVCSFIRQNAEKVTAIGEVGLDYWKVKEEREKQKEIFKTFISLAKELDKPLVIHSRSAGKYAIEVLEQEKAERVCMHAFDGSYKNAQKGVELGYYFSIPPSIVRSEQKQKLVEHVSLEHLLLETDSPLLGPEAKKRNTPANVKVAAEEIGKIQQTSFEEVCRVTTENAKGLFKL